MQFRVITSLTKQALFVGGLFICAFSYSLSAWAGYKSHQLIDNQLIVNASSAQQVSTRLTIAAYQNAGFAVTYDSQFHETLPSFAIAPSAQLIAFQVLESEESLVLTAGESRAIVDKASMTIAFYHNDKLLTTQRSFNDSAEGIGFDFAISAQEQLLGTGERVLGMNRRGHKLPLYNKAHYGYTTESTQMYYGLPAIMSTNKYVLLFDNSAKGSLDLDSQQQNQLSFSAVAGRASYAVVAGNSYPELIHHYVELTGKQPLPPKWALGNFASRFGYHTQQEVLTTAEKFAQDDIPLDATVLDLYWFGKDIQGHMGNLDWDKTAFPEPEQMIIQLQADGVETIVITEPFVLSSSNKWQSAIDSNAIAVNSDGQPYTFDFYFGNTGLIDVFNSDGRNWFNQAYQQLNQQGVTGWWGDLGEPEVHPDDIIHRLDDGRLVRGDALHNVYGHQWAKMVYNNSLAFAPNRRPLVMMRSGFVGSQRYGMIPWTGDVSREWGGLKPQVELSLQMGLLGLAYTHSDLGGFAGGEVFDAEMYTRWLQYGTFQPVYRPHAQEHIAPEPVFHDEKTKAIARDFIKLRYQMLPYNYTLAYENSVSGMPLMRPLMFEDESNLTLVAEKNSYLWGDAFLVTPVTDPGVNSVKVHMPQGIWFDFWTDQELNQAANGQAIVDYPTELTTIPVMVRAGSFVPMAAAMTNTKQHDQSQLTLHYYHHASVQASRGQLYEDDGISPNSLAEQAFQLFNFNARFLEQTLMVDITRSGNSYKEAPSETSTEFIVHNWSTAPNSIVIDGQKQPIVYSKQGFSLASAGGYWSAKDKTLHIKLSLDAANQQLAIR
ncbi:TIM-barrel domain-containing protein [Colwellia sp. MEBiC06753]